MNITPIAVVTKTIYIPGVCDLTTCKDAYYTRTKGTIKTIGVAANGFNPIATEGPSVDAHGAQAATYMMDVYSKTSNTERAGPARLVSHTDFHMKVLNAQLPELFHELPFINIANLARELFGIRKVSLVNLIAIYDPAVGVRPDVGLAEGQHTAEQIRGLAAFDARAILDIFNIMAAQKPEEVVAWVKEVSDDLRGVDSREHPGNRAGK